MEKVKVELGERSYLIHIGRNLLGEAGRILREIFPNVKKTFIISDENVFPLHGEKLAQSLKLAEFSVHLHIIASGEESKVIESAKTIYDKLYESNIERTEPIIALGGGVVGDLTGFVAGTWLRGVPFVQIPTTVEACIDASIGGKVAVNHPKGKNLIGLFYQPKVVIIDTETLKTLSKRDVIAGLAESIKHAVIKDRKFFDFHKQNTERILRLDDSVIEELLAWNCRIKANVVSEDEREKELRAILNFGHTVGHVIEVLEEFKIRHGEAVAIGMVAAGVIARELGLLSEDEFSDMENLIQKFGLPTRWKMKGDFDLIYEIMQRDKKVRDGKVRFILPIRIGEVVIREVMDKETIRKGVEYICK